MFQSVTGATPLLPPPGPPPPAAAHEGGHDSSQRQKQPWAEVLLDAVRGQVSSEAEESLAGLQREIQVKMRVFQGETFDEVLCEGDRHMLIALQLGGPAPVSSGNFR